MKRIFKALVLALAVSGGLVAWLLRRIVQEGAEAAPAAKADVIVIFGAGVWENGPSLALQRRVEEAARLYHEGSAPAILCSGGWSNGQSEVEVMRKLLISLRVPAAAVIPDEGGVSTRATLRHAQEFGGGQWQTFIAVSSAYHLHRIGRGAEARHMDLSVAAAKSPAWNADRMALRSHLREVFAGIRYAVTAPLEARSLSVPRSDKFSIFTRVRRQLTSRVRFLMGGADAAVAASDRIAQEIRRGIASGSDTETVLTPAAALLPPVSGSPRDPFGLRHGRLHAGIDFSCAYGSEIRAAGAGVVLMATRCGPYGNVVVIDHGGGLATVSAHLAGIVVACEQAVAKGERIGFAGTTGRAFGPHLHFEVRIHGTPVDPRCYLS